MELQEFQSAIIDVPDCQSDPLTHTHSLSQNCNSWMKHNLNCLEQTFWLKRKSWSQLLSIVVTFGHPQKLWIQTSIQTGFKWVSIQLDCNWGPKCNRIGLKWRLGTDWPTDWIGDPFSIEKGPPNPIGDPPPPIDWPPQLQLGGPPPRIGLVQLSKAPFLMGILARFWPFFEKGAYWGVRSPLSIEKGPIGDLNPMVIPLWRSIGDPPNCNWDPFWLISIGNRPPIQSNWTPDCQSGPQSNPIANWGPFSIEKWPFWQSIDLRNPLQSKSLLQLVRIAFQSILELKLRAFVQT